MPLLRALNNAINAAYHWLGQHKFEFWATVMLTWWFVPITWDWLTLVADHWHPLIGMQAVSLLANVIGR